MQTWFGCVTQFHLLHLFAHLLDFGADSALCQLDLRDLLVDSGLIRLPIVVLDSQLVEIVNENLILFSAIEDVLLGFLLILRTSLLKLSDLFLHVLKMLVKLVDKLRVFLLLSHDLLRLLLDMVPINGHEALHFIRIILLLHSLLNVLDKLLDLVLLLLRGDLGFLPEALQIDNRLLFLVNILLHLSQTLGLHIE